MWTVDDEIRDELSDIAKQLNYVDGNNSSKADNNNSADNNNGKSLDGKLIERIENVIKRAEEMIYKEDCILTVPLILRKLSGLEYITIPKIMPCALIQYQTDGRKQKK